MLWGQHDTDTHVATLMLTRPALRGLRCRKTRRSCSRRNAHAHAPCAASLLSFPFQPAVLNVATLMLTRRSHDRAVS